MLNAKIVNYKKMREISMYSCKETCNDKLLLNNQTIVKYSCITYTNCQKSLFQSKYKHFINKFSLNQSKNINLYASHKYVYQLMFRLTDFGQKLINDERRKLGWSYVGIHIRTFGYFKDFKENPREMVPKHFSFTRIIKGIDDYIIVRDIKRVYLCSDSIKFKLKVSEYFNNPKKILFKNTTTNHNRFFKNEIDKQTFTDLELLSSADSNILTKISTFSLLVYMKNKNCTIKNCIFL